MNEAGSARPRKVPKASLTIWSAVASSLSWSGRTEIPPFPVSADAGREFPGEFEEALSVVDSLIAFVLLPIVELGHDLCRARIDSR
jgi:hypothetical protein